MQQIANLAGYMALVLPVPALNVLNGLVAKTLVMLAVMVCTNTYERNLKFNLLFLTVPEKSSAAKVFLKMEGCPATNSENRTTVVFSNRDWESTESGWNRRFIAIGTPQGTIRRSRPQSRCVLLVDSLPASDFVGFSRATGGIDEEEERERERERELGSFENSYILENPRTPTIPYISQTLFFRKCFATGLKFARFLAPRSRFFEKSRDLLRTHIFPRTRELPNPNFNHYERFGGYRSRFFERNNGLGDIRNWGSSRILGNI
ncbi:hypothetical protein LXL04_020431 [Taraxacum kok-saghyz]